MAIPSPTSSMKKGNDTVEQREEPLNNCLSKISEDDLKAILTNRPSKDAARNPEEFQADLRFGELPRYSKTNPNGVSKQNHALANGDLKKRMPKAESSAEGQTSYPSPPGLPQPEVVPIAVVGMACRLPGGSTNPEKLWNLLAEGKSAWSTVHGERFTQSSFEHPSPSIGGTFNSKGAHFLTEDISLFDAGAFNISPLEARAMDPQMRLQLEVAYEALENGGITLERIAGSKTAVFIGVFSDDYSNMMLCDPESLPSHHVTGTALHQACQSIRSGESEQAIVGGVNLMLSPKTVMSLGGLGFLSDEGRCYSFDNRGSGYGRGEGVATVVLKPLVDAIADGDPIRAVIRNTVVNQDGRTNGLTMPSSQAQTIMMQDAYLQAGLDPVHTQYVEAHGTGTKAGDPIEVQAIATALTNKRDPSNPLMIGSVKANIGHLESASGLAGLVKAILCVEKGMIPPSINFDTENQELNLSQRNLKVSRKLQAWPSDGVRRASLNSFGYGGTNAHVILDSYQDRIKVSNNGHQQDDQNTDMAITNGGHDVEAQPSDSEGRRHHKRIILLTHRTKVGIGHLAADLRKYIIDRLELTDGDVLDRLAYTINARRTRFNWRCAISAGTPDELAAALAHPSLGSRKVFRDPRLAFIFTGQGAQWHAMGRELIGRYGVFNTTLHSAENQIRNLGASWSVLDELLKNPADSRVASAAIGQPLCTAIQCALVDLLSSWNVKPESVMGHSSGEFAAAYACGSLTLQSALAISYHRGLLASTKLEQNLELRGGMLAVGVSEAEAELFISRVPPDMGKAVVACVNSPRSVTISGDRSAITSVQSMLEARQIFVRRLGVSTAYHSHHMEIVAHKYLAALEHLPLPSSNSEVRFFSSVTGDLMDGSMLDGAYWVKNMVSQVKFSQALQRLCRASDAENVAAALSLNNRAKQLLVEIGPHSALAGSVKQTLNNKEISDFKYIATLVRGQDAVDTILNAASDLAIGGIAVNLETVNSQGHARSPRVLSDLPPYPWDHAASYWHELRLSLDYRKRPAPRHPLLGAPTPDFNPLEPSWRNIIRLSEIPWLRGHDIQSNIVYPAAGFIAMAIEAAVQRWRHERATETIARCRLKEVSIGKPLLVPDTSEGVETQFILRPYNSSTRKSSDHWKEFRVFSYSKVEGWSEHCRGLVMVQPDQCGSDVEGHHETHLKLTSHAKRVADIDDACRTFTNVEELYESLKRIGMSFQDAFQCIKDAKACAQHSTGHIEIPNTAKVMPAGLEHPYLLHPTTLDACMQLTTPILLEIGALQLPMVPTYIEEIVVSHDLPRQAGERLKVHCDLKLSSKRSLTANITANQEATGNTRPPMIEIKGLQCTAIPGGFVAEDHLNGDSGKCHRLRWIPVEADSLDTTITSDESLQAQSAKSRFSHVSLVLPALASPASHTVSSTLASISSKRLVQTFSSLDEVLDTGLQGAVCVCLLELNGSILKDLTEPQWKALRKLLSSASNVLWVTKGGAMSVQNPESGLISGLARSAMSDNPALRFVTVDTDPDNVTPEDTARSIVSLLDKAFPANGSERLSADLEYVERNGQLLIPRG